MKGFLSFVAVPLLASAAMVEAAGRQYACPPAASIVQQRSAQTTMDVSAPKDQVVEGYDFSATNASGQWRGFVPSRRTIVLHHLVLKHEELDRYLPICSYTDEHGNEVRLTLYH